MIGQKEMPFLGQVKAPAFANPELVKSCKNGLDAIRLCVQLSRFSQEYICEQLGIDPGHFTRMMQGRAHFPDAKRKTLMVLCGNYAPVQFDAWSLGLELKEPSKSERIRELEKELERLRTA